MTFPKSIASGGVVAVASLAYALAYAALIFSGAGLGETELAFGVGAALLATAISSLAVSALSSFPFAIGGIDSNAAAVLASIAANVAPLVVLSPTHVAVVNVLFVLAIATATTGAFLFVLGSVRAGRWIRFIPLPVIGGFLAAAGWLIVSGAARVAAGTPLTLDRAQALVSGTGGLQLLVACLFAGLIVLVRQRFAHALALPAVLVAGVVVALAVFAALHIPVTQARIDGWLFSVPPDAHVWVPWSTADFGLIEWDVMRADAGGIATLSVVTAITILLTCTGLELQTRTEIDLDRELRAQGASNILTAAFGGFTSYISLSRTLMNYGLGATDRWAGPVVAAVAIAFAFGGIGLIGFIPKFVLCGLLLTMGVALLEEWLVRSRRRVSFAEYAVIWVILLIIVHWGYAAGLLVGLFLGALMFVLTYSRISAIKQEFTGRDFASNLQRSPEETHALQLHGEQTRILFLQGFIFFGMADRLYREVSSRAFGGTNVARFVVLDFSGVDGIDSSATSSFVKLVRAAKEHRARIVFARMHQNVERAWLAGAGNENADALRFPDIDRALEWTEGEILREWSETLPQGRGLRAWLAEEFDDEVLAEKLASRLVPIELAAGEILCREGETADSMFFVEQGRVGVFLGPEGTRIRLRSLGFHTLLGEMGLYRKMARSASVIAEEPSLVYVLTREVFEQFRIDDPELRSAIDGLIVMSLAERLSYGNALIAALSR